MKAVKWFDYYSVLTKADQTNDRFGSNETKPSTLAD
ncbi:MAG: hypothetical protein K0S23_3715 [Fluviicola sp.]|jgi:hypothetical protein|nr:hypothetical protein [Fluviicola sp.]